MLIKSILSDVPNTVLRKGMIVVIIHSMNTIHLLHVGDICMVTDLTTQKFDIITFCMRYQFMYPQFGLKADDIRCADSAEKRKFRKQLKLVQHANIN